MKKLLVLALSVVMILAFAAVSMAAATVTIGGELAVTNQWGSADGNTGYGRLNGDDSSNVKITAALNDDVSAVFQIDLPFNLGQTGTTISDTWGNSNAYFDNSYIQVKNLAGGTLKVGRTGWQSPGLDINMRNAKGYESDPNGDADPALINVVYAYPVADSGFTVTGGYQFAHTGAEVQTNTWENLDGMGAVEVNYTKDQYIADAFYNALDASYDVMFGYKVTDAFTVKVMTGDTGNKDIATNVTLTQYNNKGLVLNYTANGLYAIAEYDSNDTSNPNRTCDNADFVRLGYTFANGFGLQYDWNNNTPGNNNSNNQIMAFVKF
jgi:hypothetical protein